MRKKSFFETEEPTIRASRYGLSEAEWATLTPDERAIHYNRQNVCDHPYVYTGPDNDDIRTSWSFDPYAHTAHLMPHDVDLSRRGRCECQTCDGKFGIPRGEEKRHINPDVLREKLKLI